MKPKLLNSYPLALEAIRLLILYRQRVDNMRSKHLPCKISKEVLHRMKSKWEMQCRKWIKSWVIKERMPNSQKGDEKLDKKL